MRAMQCASTRYIQSVRDRVWSGERECVFFPRERNWRRAPKRGGELRLKRPARWLAATPSREGVAPLRRARSKRARTRTRSGTAEPARRSARETTAPVN